MKNLLDFLSVVRWGNVLLGLILLTGFIAMLVAAPLMVIAILLLILIFAKH